MAQEMKKLSQILIESEGVRKQILYSLFQLESDSIGGTSICGYCALGAIACELGITRDSKNFFERDTSRIMKKITDLGYDLSTEYQCPDCLKESEDNNVAYNTRQRLQYHREIGNLIYHLNDEHQWTFKQIGEFLASKGL